MRKPDLAWPGLVYLYTSCPYSALRTRTCSAYVESRSPLPQEETLENMDSRDEPAQVNSLVLRRTHATLRKRMGGTRARAAAAGDGNDDETGKKWKRGLIAELLHSETVTGMAQMICFAQAAPPPCT